MSFCVVGPVLNVLRKWLGPDSQSFSDYIYLGPNVTDVVLEEDEFEDDEDDGGGTPAQFFSRAVSKVCCC